jgi:hypothetical protein
MSPSRAPGPEVTEAKGNPGGLWSVWQDLGKRVASNRMLFVGLLAVARTLSLRLRFSNA